MPPSQEATDSTYWEGGDWTKGNLCAMREVEYLQFVPKYYIITYCLTLFYLIRATAVKDIFMNWYPDADGSPPPRHTDSANTHIPPMFLLWSLLPFPLVRLGIYSQLYQAIALFPAFCQAFLSFFSVLRLLTSAHQVPKASEPSLHWTAGKSLLLPFPSQHGLHPGVSQTTGLFPPIWGKICIPTGHIS